MTQQHPFHMVNQSPWPLTGASGALLITTGLMMWFHTQNPNLLLLGLLTTSLTAFQWWRDISRESTFEGAHTHAMGSGLRWGMMFFITSEVLFFFAFFWAFFHSSLAPTIELGIRWPPMGMQPLNPFHVPLLNTAVLLASGVTVTWAHHSLISSTRTETLQALTFTMTLGIYFTTLQLFEYYQTPFNITDATYGSTFFVATGFHGFHVIMGSTFLTACLIRQTKFHFSNNHHFGFEAAAWYWHFVDVVWLFLFISIYWWGS